MEKAVKTNESIIHTLRRRMRVWLNRDTLANRFAGILITIGIVCGLLTYGALTNVPPFGQSSSALIVMLNLDLILLLGLVVFVCRRLITLYIRRKRGMAGSNLHIRLVFIFSLLAALPAMFMAVFSVGFFYFGLHGWLDDRVRSAITESEAVANAYLAEHQQLIRADAMAMASDLDRQADILTTKTDAMHQMLKTQSFLRNFANVYLFNGQGAVQAQADGATPFDFTAIPYAQIQAADKNQIIILDDKTDSIQAFLKLKNYDDLYLFAERTVDPKVLGHVERTRQGVAQYEDLQKHSTRLQVLLTAIYLVVTLLLTVAAVWYGLSFAQKLINPISNLIKTAEHVREGDLSARVDTKNAMDEFKMLGRAFNNMTEQIENQQQALITANTQMDFRRRFTETILGGVSTGILSVDQNGHITLANNASGDLLMESIENLLGQKISRLMPEISVHLDDAFAQGRLGVVHNCEINIRRNDGSARVFMARIVIEKMDENQNGAIITFDDLTTVMATQRKAAWADVARRIAHEIKNPLTPIQLSAERLNRKYRKFLEPVDQAIFDQYTDTIIRHVGDIKTMVNAFSDFAKMPDPVMRDAMIMPIITDIVSLSKHGYDHVAFDLSIADEVNHDRIMTFDEQQIRQVLTNLIKNAVEATEETQETDKQIRIFCVNYPDPDHLCIAVNDNGPGLPSDNIEKLIEPYVTHKPKGTGLGLAIVKKIVEDHEGELLFSPYAPMINNNAMTTDLLPGAFVAIILPYKDHP